MGVVTNVTRWLRRPGDERGQAVTEYALVTVLCAMALLGVLAVYLRSTVIYYVDAMDIIQLIIP